MLAVASLCANPKSGLAKRIKYCIETCISIDINHSALFYGSLGWGKVHSYGSQNSNFVENI